MLLLLSAFSSRDQDDSGMPATSLETTCVCTSCGRKVKVDDNRLLHFLDLTVDDLGDVFALGDVFDLGDALLDACDVRPLVDNLGDCLRGDTVSVAFFRGGCGVEKRTSSARKRFKPGLRIRERLGVPDKLRSLRKRER